MATSKISSLYALLQLSITLIACISILFALTVKLMTATREPLRDVSLLSKSELIVL